MMINSWMERNRPLYVRKPAPWVSVITRSVGGSLRLPGVKRVSGREANGKCCGAGSVVMEYTKGPWRKQLSSRPYLQSVLQPASSLRQQRSFSIPWTRCFRAKTRQKLSAIEWFLHFASATSLCQNLSLSPHGDGRDGLWTRAGHDRGNQ